MKNLFLGLCISLFGTATVNAQDVWHNNGNGWYYHPPQYTYFYRPQVVGYMPVVQWYPQGTWLNVGPVVISPDRRYVTLGINAGFTDIRSVETFNFYNGQTNTYPYYR